MSAEAKVMSRTVVEEIADVVAATGCRHMFTLMGAGNLWLIHHLDVDHQISIHHLRHENGAIGAADGLARSTGELAWCTVTQGPGFTNTITALLTADRGRAPMILIVSDSSNLDPAQFPFAGGVQALAPEAILHPLGIRTVRATGDDAAAQLSRAVALAREESRPVVFVIPAGLDRLPAAGEGNRETTAPAAGQAPEPIDATEVRRAADALSAADKVVVLVGRGALAAGSAAAAIELAERIGAPISTTVPASGALGEHPLVIGQFGGFSIGETERLIEEADCIVAIGASLNTFQTRKGRFVEGKTIIRIDLEPIPVDGTRTIPIIADAMEGTRALTVEVITRGLDRTAAAFRDEKVEDDVSQSGALDPRTVCRRLDSLLPRKRRVFVDNGHFGAFPMLYLKHREPRSLIWMPDFGAVGSALAASFASAAADRGTQTVLFIGDCGLYLTLGDLETAVREQVPLIVICMNDGAAGSELVHMQDWGVPPGQAIFGYNDIAKLARGMGAQGVSVTELGQLDDALAGWRPGGGPLVIDCHISREVRSPIYAHV